MAFAKSSVGIYPSAARGTCTTFAPRGSCACQICALVGNSKSLITTLLRGPEKSSALASALRPADTDAVTAISSADALSNFAVNERTDSFLVIQTSQFA